MYKIPVLATIALLAGLPPTGALAHAEEDGTGRDGPPIVVLGGTLDLPPGSPAYSETVIDAARLRADAAGRVEDVLRDIAGFSQFRRSDSRSANPSAQGANLRSLGGNAASRTLLLLDGVPMADPFFGYIPYSAIVPDRLSAIRVARGGGGGAFGAGAVAGTIAMTSATRADLPLAAASAFYGSRNAAEVSATVSPDIGDGFISLSGRYERGDGFNTTPVNQRVPATVPARYEGWSTSLRAVAPVGDRGEIQARILLYRDNRTLRFAGADSHAEGQDASVRFLSHGAWQLDALAYVQARNFSNIVVSSSTYRKSLDQRDTPALGAGGKIEVRPPVGAAHLFRVGVDARHASGTMREEAYNANLATNPLTQRRLAYGRQLTAGAFVEDDWTIGPLILTGGARVDHWTIGDARLERMNAAGALLPVDPTPDRSGWEAGGRAGMVWRTGAILSFRAAAYTGFRLPTLNELYRGFTVFPVTTNANPNLSPERLRGAEVGLDLTPAPGIAIALTAFDNRLDNAIANVTTAITVDAVTRIRRNVDAIEARGLELAASARSDDLTLSGSYTYTRARVRDSSPALPGQRIDGRDPAQSPRHAGSATLAWTPGGGARFAGTVRYTGRQYEDDLNRDSLPAALTMDAFARVPLGHGVSLIGRAENIFDEAVYSRRVSSGAGPVTLSEDLGTPRIIWIGVEFGLGH